MGKNDKSITITLKRDSVLSILIYAGMDTDRMTDTESEQLSNAVDEIALAVVVATEATRSLVDVAVDILNATV